MHYNGGVKGFESDTQIIADLGGTRAALSRGVIQYPTCGKARGRGGKTCDRTVCDSNWNDFGMTTEALEAIDQEGDEWRQEWNSRLRQTG